MDKPTHQSGLAISLSALTSAWTILCPHDHHPLADAFQNQVQGRHGRFWLLTTESRPELSAQLRLWEPRPTRLTTKLDWGQCPSCSTRFAMVTVSIGVQEQKRIGPRTCDTSAPQPLRLAQARHAHSTSSWLTTQVSTPLGMIHQHTFGPVSSETNLWVWLETSLRPLWPDLLTFADRERQWPDGGLFASATQRAPDRYLALELDPVF